MAHRVAVAAASLALVLVAGCCCPQDCGPAACDPLREVGVDYRGLVGPHTTVVPERQVFLDMIIARVPEARVQTALGGDRPLHAGAPKVVSAARAQALVAAWRRDPAIEVTSAPKMLTLPDQEASIFVGETVRFAKTVATEAGELAEGVTLDGETVRYRRTAAVTNQEGGLEFSVEEDPHGPVTLGMEIRMVPKPSADGRTLTLDMMGSWRELKQELSPEATATMSAAEFESYVREHRLDTSFTMPSDGRVVLGNPAWIETGAGRVLQVTLLHAVVLDGHEKITQE